MTGIDTYELVWLVIGLLVAGGITGMLAGLFGVGGGTVAVPILYELFRYLGVPEDVRMQLCIGTSLAIIVPTSIRSYYSHKERGAIDMALLRSWVVPILAGVIIGSMIARFAPADLFKIIFVMVAGFTAIRLLFAKDNWYLGTTYPSKIVVKLVGAVIGVLASLMGIGGGQLSTLFMTFYKRPIHEAVATSAGVGVLISIPGALGYIFAGWPTAALYPDVAALQPPLTLGYVSLVGFLLFIPTSIYMAPIGAKLAHRLSRRKLEMAFGLFLTAICLRFLYSIFF
ncbi:sulfite exporter TauE/SafE family protein [Paenochrobactrum pullorum]|uniref:sulfite exporter TauE/SafE family protein n=1 Tax=Paenochrobactrum pullorum TaxID=1324351 RepID=UPI0035BBA9FC